MMRVLILETELKKNQNSFQPQMKLNKRFVKEYTSPVT